MFIRPQKHYKWHGLATGDIIIYCRLIGLEKWSQVYFRIKFANCSIYNLFLYLPLLACRLLERFFLVKFVAKLDLDSLFRFAWRCDIFPASFVTSFVEDFLLFLKFPPESNIQASIVINYLSVTHSTTYSHFLNSVWLKILMSFFCPCIGNLN